MGRARLLLESFEAAQTKEPQSMQEAGRERSIVGTGRVCVLPVNLSRCVCAIIK